MLMLVAGSDDPIGTALTVRRRWAYILGVAKAAQRGFMLDASLPQVMEDCHRYADRAQKVVSALDEWMSEQMGRRG